MYMQIHIRRNEEMSANGKQNAFVFYVSLLAYAVIAVLLRTVALAPLACLFVMEGCGRWLSILSPMIILFVILPLRTSFAQAMMQHPRRFSFCKAFCLKGYWGRLGSELMHVLHVLKWGIPFAALVGAAGYAYTSIDALTLFQSINDLGNRCAEIFKVNTVNNFMLGIYAVAAVYGLGLLVWLLGAVRNSASRYLRAYAVERGIDLRSASKRALRGRRLAQLGVALINLILWAPFLYVIGDALKMTVSDLSTVLMMATTTGRMPALDLMAAAVPAAAAFAGLYLTLLPIRRWNTASFVLRGCEKADRKVEA